MSGRQVRGEREDGPVAASEPGLRARAGISLVEIVVAMVLMSAVLIPVAGLTALGANQSVRGAGTTYRQGILNQEVNRLTALPFATLPSMVGCTTVGAGVFPHTRCVAVTNVSSTLRRVEVIVTPAQPGVRPDTARFDRANPPAGNPLSTS